MPPKIALLLCIIFIVYLFKTDYKRNSALSLGIWVPIVWMLILGSRPVSLWMNLETPTDATMDYLEGSPVDRHVFSLLIILGIIILLRRGMNWSKIFKQNVPLFIFMAYCGVSILWSDFEYVAFKRYIKEIGTFIMVFIVLSEKNRVEAVKTLLRRCAYILMPLSAVLIKYYPDVGRGFGKWTGEAFYCGVTDNKNSLGVLCLVFGIYFTWNLVVNIRRKSIDGTGEELFPNIALLLIILWLFVKANSATSLLCFIISLFVIFGMRLQIFRQNPKAFMRSLLAVVLVVFVFAMLIDLKGMLFSSLNRNENLTGRTDIWGIVLGFKINPCIGTGYQSFWLGDRTEEIWDRYNFHMVQAHNGYLETYLNTGLIGLTLLCGVIVSVYGKIMKEMNNDVEFGTFRLAMIIVILLHNTTEASFNGLSFLWVIFLIIGIERPKLLRTSPSNSVLLLVV